MQRLSVQRQIWILRRNLHVRSNEKLLLLLVALMPGSAKACLSLVVPDPEQQQKMLSRNILPRPIFPDRLYKHLVDSKHYFLFLIINSPFFMHLKFLGEYVPLFKYMLHRLSLTRNIRTLHCCKYSSCCYRRSEER